MGKAPQRTQPAGGLPGVTAERFELSEHAGEAGPFSLARVPEPSCLLVLAGVATRTDVGRRYGPGDGFCAARGEPVTLVGPARLWRVAGSPGLVGALGHSAALLARKDPPTAAHSARVAVLAAAMGRELGWGSPRLEQLSLAAYLHDLGKLGLPGALLANPDALTLPGWRRMARHPREGRRLLENTPLAFAATVAEQHHERLDGSGYPAGVRGDALTFESQLVAVADTFDAITEGRPYWEPRSPAQALSEINRYGGILFLPEAVAALNAVTQRIRS